MDPPPLDSAMDRALPKDTKGEINTMMMGGHSLDPNQAPDQKALLMKHFFTKPRNFNHVGDLNNYLDKAFEWHMKKVGPVTITCLFDDFRDYIASGDNFDKLDLLSSLHAEFTVNTKHPQSDFVFLADAIPIPFTYKVNKTYIDKDDLADARQRLKRVPQELRRSPAPYPPFEDSHDIQKILMRNLENMRQTAIDPSREEEDWENDWENDWEDGDNQGAGVN